MPVVYSIDKNRRLVVTTSSGRVTVAELQAHQNGLLNDPDFNPEYNQLLDLTAVTALDVSVEELAVLARRAMFSAASRRAWVASTPAVYGMGRLAIAHHELSGSPAHASAFYDLSSALEWLGLDAQPTKEDGGGEARGLDRNL